MKHLFLLFLFFQTLTMSAQTLNVVAGNLRQPVGIDVAADGKVWVAEAGTGMNNGAVSVLNTDGSLSNVITGLPSLFDSNSQRIAGPWRCMQLSNQRLGVVVPLLGGVLVFDLTGFVPGVTPPLSVADTVYRVVISDFVVANEPPGMPDTDPYSAVLDSAGSWYVVDAAFNGIVKVDVVTGARSVFAAFPRFPNPLPFGPPMIDPVPTRILNGPDGSFYVCSLTGFPFLDGTAAVYKVDKNGVVSTYADNMTLLTDMALDPNTGDLYALQFSRFSLDTLMPGFVPNSAQVTRIKPDGSRQVIAQNFGPAAGLCLNAAGDLYITGTFAGLVWKLDHATSGLHELTPAVADWQVSPNPSNGQVDIAYHLEGDSPVQFMLYDMTGKPVFSRQSGEMPAGENRSSLDIRQQAPGVYFLEVKTRFGQRVQRIILR